MKTTQPIQVPVATHRKAKIYCAARGKTLTELAGEAIEAYLYVNEFASQESPAAGAAKAAP